MTQLELAKAIGCHDSTLRRMPPTKRKQWQSLAAKGRTIAWFDVLAQLCFEVDAFNAKDKDRITFEMRGDDCQLWHFDSSSNFIARVDVFSINQLTEALSYVRGLNQ